MAFLVSVEGPPPPLGQSQFVRNDPGTVAVRRCLELGGGDLERIGKGFTTGLFDMAGVNPDAMQAAAVTGGLRTGGTYQADNGPGIIFSSDAAHISACGKLVPEQPKYSVAKRGDLLLVEIENEPKPLLVVPGPDGRLRVACTWRSTRPPP